MLYSRCLSSCIIFELNWITSANFTSKRIMDRRVIVKRLSGAECDRLLGLSFALSFVQYCHWNVEVFIVLTHPILWSNSSFDLLFVRHTFKHIINLHTHGSCYFKYFLFNPFRLRLRCNSKSTEFSQTIATCSLAQW